MPKPCNIDSRSDLEAVFIAGDEENCINFCSLWANLVTSWKTPTLHLPNDMSGISRPQGCGIKAHAGQAAVSRNKIYNPTPYERPVFSSSFALRSPHILSETVGRDRASASSLRNAQAGLSFKEYTYMPGWSRREMRWQGRCSPSMLRTR